MCVGSMHTAHMETELRSPAIMNLNPKHVVGGLIHSLHDSYMIFPQPHEKEYTYALSLSNIKIILCNNKTKW